MGVKDVLRHLIQFGPARNDQERDELLAAVDADEAPAQPVTPAESPEVPPAAVAAPQEPVEDGQP
jgi:hypothetical protein